MTDGWLSFGEIAHYIGIKKDTVCKWVGNCNMNAIQRIVAAIGILNLGFTSTVIGGDVAALIEQLGAWNKNQAKKASDELAAMGKPVVSEVANALSGKGRRRGRFAARTLRQIGQDAADAIPALSKSLNAPDALTREYAVEALAKMVKQADQVIPVLQEAMNDGSEDLREKARLAIIQLTESLESQGQVESTRQLATETHSTETAAQNKDTTKVVQHELLRSNSANTSGGSVVLGADSPGKKGHFGKLSLMMFIRSALLTFVVAGFFLLLYVCRE
ncbi:MAG: HEAT repeat domain-containing protein [Planctomycetota bacterium]|nr:HEAT repeat domain-containing protein [Planctomycetota bacterium]